MGSRPTFDKAAASRVSSSWLQFWDRSGVPIEKPKEWQPARLEIRHEGAPWTELRLYRNEEQLPLRQEEIRGAVRTVAPWPRSGPGRYRLRLVGPAGQRERRISIWPSKIQRAEYETLIADLESRLPAQIALALQQAGGLAGVDVQPPGKETLAEEVVRLRRAVDGTEGRLGLADVLSGLAGDPHRVLTTEERWVRSGRARRPATHRLGQAFARPDNVEEGHPKQVPDVRTRHTTDVYENRLLLQFARQVRLRLRRIEPILRDRRSDGSLAEEVETLRDQMKAARRHASFLRDVSALRRPPTRASMVLQKRPLYRAALEGYLEFHRDMSVALDAPELEAPLNNLPKLYQVWGSLIVIRAFVEEAASAGFLCERDSLFRRNQGFWMLRLSEGAVRLDREGMQMTVRPERSYSTGGVGLRSVSFTQRPDLAIEVQRPSGRREIYLFDPKYKLDVSSGGDGEEASAGTPKKSDIDKMHAYRDAIRGPEGEQVVRYAAILYPGGTEQYSTGLEAIEARPGREEQLLERARGIARRVINNEQFQFEGKKPMSLK